MKILRNLRFVLVLLMLSLLLIVPMALAAPQADGFVPTSTPIPTATPLPTITPIATIPVASPEPSATSASPAAVETAPLNNAQTDATAQTNNVPDQTSSATAAAAGSSVLSFLLCGGLILVVGLATLNIWARRRP